LAQGNTTQLCPAPRCLASAPLAMSSPATPPRASSSTAPELQAAVQSPAKRRRLRAAAVARRYWRRTRWQLLAEEDEPDLAAVAALSARKRVRFQDERRLSREHEPQKLGRQREGLEPCQKQEPLGHEQQERSEQSQERRTLQRLEAGTQISQQCCTLEEAEALLRQGVREVLEEKAAATRQVDEQLKRYQQAVETLEQELKERTRELKELQRRFEVALNDAEEHRHSMQSLAEWKEELGGLWVCCGCREDVKVEAIACEGCGVPVHSGCVATQFAGKSEGHGWWCPKCLVPGSDPENYSGSDSSSSTEFDRPVEDPQVLRCGDRVRLCGLKSEAGQALNGRLGVITKPDHLSGRFGVKVCGLDTERAILAASLRRCA